MGRSTSGRPRTWLTSQQAPSPMCTRAWRPPGRFLTPATPSFSRSLALTGAWPQSRRAPAATARLCSAAHSPSAKTALAHTGPARCAFTIATLILKVLCTVLTRPRNQLETVGTSTTTRASRLSTRSTPALPLHSTAPASPAAAISSLAARSLSGASPSTRLT